MNDGAVKDKLGIKHIMVIIAGCGMVGTTIGLIMNIIGLFFLPMAQDLKIGQGTVALTLTVFNLMHALSGTMAPRYIEKLGFKKTVIIAAAIQMITTYLISLSGNITHLIILNIIRGFASGAISMVTATIMINYWFNRNSSLAVSIVMCVSGVVGAIMSPIMSSFISSYGWRSAHVLLAVLVFLFDLPAIILPIDIRPELVNERPYGEEKQQEKIADASVYSASVFYLLFAFTLAASFATALPQYYSGIVANYGLIGIGALMMSICMFVNSAGKLILGIMIGKIGNRRSVYIYIALLAIGNLLILLFRDRMMLMISSALYGTCYSLTTVAAASLCREKVGMANYDKVYPKIAMAATFGNAIANYLVGLSYDMSGSYYLSMIVLQIVISLMFLVVFMLYREK